MTELLAEAWLLLTDHRAGAVSPKHREAMRDQKRKSEAENREAELFCGDGGFRDRF